MPKTANKPIIAVDIDEVLMPHFQDLFTETHFTAMYSLKGKARHKADIAKEIGVNYLIDDSVEHIEKAVEVGITGLLYGDYPWQKEQEPRSGIVRVKNWQEVLEYFDATG
jgi:5'(3')-deoxyribonucleotidase